MDRTTRLRLRYEAEVQAIANLGSSLMAEGVQVEEIARRLHKQRRAIGIRYKLRTPLWGRQGQVAIYRRNVRRYGDAFGPSLTWLRRQGRTWEEICEKAGRTGGHDLS